MTSYGQFKCARCGGVFDKAWTDEEAAKEYEKLWPEEAAADLESAVICDDCFQELRRQFAESRNGE